MTTSNSAGVYNFTLMQGSDFSRQVNLTDADGEPIDLTGYSARMQARVNYFSAAKIIDIVSNPDPDVASKIILNSPDTGSFLIKISAAVSSAIDPNEYVYDLELVDGTGIITRLLQGTMTVSAEVTR